jgi:hypothetical protein
MLTRSLLSLLGRALCTTALRWQGFGLVDTSSVRSEVLGTAKLNVYLTLMAVPGYFAAIYLIDRLGRYAVPVRCMYGRVHGHVQAGMVTAKTPWNALGTWDAWECLGMCVLGSKIEA